MVKYWLKKFKESSLSILPIFVVILILYLVELIPFPAGLDPNYTINGGDMLLFAFSALMIAIGMGLFTAGAEQSMSEIGQLVGASLMKKRNIFFVVAMTFILGVFVTVAEPDLAVLGDQIGVSKAIIVWSISVGVGLFLIIGVLRVLFQKNLNILFIVFYGLCFTIVYFVNPKFLPICFDSGGVTTGPITVPFLLAFGLGIASSRGGKTSSDSFGLTALCSIGPILTLMVISRFIDLPDSYPISSYLDMLDMPIMQSIGSSILTSLSEVGLALLPVIGFFIIYDLIFIRLPFKKLLKIMIGLVYAFVGLTIHLSAVRSGFQPVAIKIGLSFGSSSSFFGIAIVCAALFGLFGVLAEPAVHILVRQVEVVSEGSIHRISVMAVLSVSIGLAVALQIVRAYFRFDLMYYLIPGYILALGLSFVVPKIYTAIAFDAGGVASGPMTSTFILPFCIGFSYANLTEQGLSTDAVYQFGFGLVSMCAMMPLIVLQGLGLYVKVKQDVQLKKAKARLIEPNDDQIIHFGEAKQA